MTRDELRALVVKQQEVMDGRLAGNWWNYKNMVNTLHAAIEAHECEWERLIVESPRALAYLKTDGTMYKLSNPSYDHRAFVTTDGPPDFVAFKTVALVPVPKPVEEGDGD